MLIFFLGAVFSNQKTDSPHGAGFKISCKTCHSSKGWQLDKEIYSFDHSKTKLALGGQHTVINCRQCHTTLVFSEAKTDCIECHKDVHQTTTGPDCSRCHTPASWLVSNITEIHQMSRFPLVGAHRTADCFQCHKSESLERFDVQGVNCIDCHRENYLATSNPNHIQSGISEDCSLCHPITSFQWTGIDFSHPLFTLDKGHLSLKCSDCHKTANFTDANPACSSCHEQDYIAAKNPDHLASQFSIICQDCHSLNPGWKPASFSHTSFPLTLGHSIPGCNDCHKGGNYTTTSPDCYSCHQPNYTSSTNPNHIAAGFATVCTQCHNTNTGWKPATFNHGSFPLTLGHATPACTDCHIGGNYTTTSPDCYSCHQPNYTSSINPNHIAAGFPTVCTQCHNTNTGWKPATFNHGSFPLTLGHSTPACADCHTGGNYTTTSPDCYSCHQPNYTASTNPNHISAGFPTACATCHTTTPGWKPASFNHTTFPLTLGHATPTCADCHKGNYTSTSTDCYTCHVTDFNNSTNPNHRTIAFPTTCTQCHSTNPGWQPATYAQHDAQMFPIYSGRHKGQWTLCSECHTNTANYLLFDCKICHSDAHRSNNYSNAQCYSCHPKGSTN